MSLIQAAFGKVSELLDNARNQVEEATEGTYGPPSDEPLTWEREGKTRGVVTLDVGKMGPQLFVGWVCQRIVPFILAERLNRTILAVEVWSGKFVGRKAMPKWAWMTQLLDELAAIWTYAEIEKIIETKIREKSLELMREFVEMNLKPKRDVRKTCMVFSRIRTLKQRKPNQSWTDTRN